VYLCPCPPRTLLDIISQCLSSSGRVTAVTAIEVMKVMWMHCPSQSALWSVMQAPVAWGLLMQHYCWYQFACYLLVHSGLCHMQRQQEQQCVALAAQEEQQEQQKQEQVWLSVQQVQQLLQMPLEALMQQVPLLPDDQLATCAAAFIAWVQQPVDASRYVLCHLVWSYP